MCDGVCARKQSGEASTYLEARGSEEIKHCGRWRPACNSMCAGAGAIGRHQSSSKQSLRIDTSPAGGWKRGRGRRLYDCLRGAPGGLSRSTRIMRLPCSGDALLLLLLRGGVVGGRDVCRGIINWASAKGGHQTITPTCNPPSEFLKDSELSRYMVRASCRMALYSKYSNVYVLATSLSGKLRHFPRLG